MNSANSALLIVDIQNDYFPGGAVELVGAVEAGAQAGRLLSAYRARSLPVIHIRHISTRPNATFFLPGTRGADIRDCVTPVGGETVFEKHFPNAFRGTPLLEHLQARQITRLTIAGMMTHMCIDTTTRAAADLGFACSLAQDACATRALSFDGVQVPAELVHAAYLAGLNGAFALVKPVDALLTALDGAGP